MPKKIMDNERIIVSMPEYDGAGIYMIRNLTTGKVYIGSTKHIYQRAKAHDLSFRNGTCNYRFLEDIQKGHKFVCEVLEECPGIMFYELRDKEEYYVQKYNSFKEGYNTACVPTYRIKSYEQDTRNYDWLTRKM